MRDRGPELAWQLVGLEDEGRFPSAGWVIPSWVVLDGKYLRSPASPNGNDPHVYPDRTLLRRFVGLAGGSDDEILRFAERWGPLDLCRHDLSSAHTLGDPNRPRLCPRRIRHGLTYESIDAWRGHSRHARAVLNLSAALYAGRSGAVADWESVGIDNWRLGGIHTNLGAVLSEWLVLGGVAPRFTWLDPSETQLGKPRIVMDGAGLFGGLAAMLLLAVVRSESVVPCSEAGCTALAEPTRRGARPYCPTHGGEATRSRDRAQTFRARHPDYYRNRRARQKDRQV